MMKRQSLRVAEHLWEIHNWKLTARVQDAEHLAEVSQSLVESHRLEHVAGAGRKWPGWQEHGHDEEIERTAR